VSITALAPGTTPVSMQYNTRLSMFRRIFASITPNRIRNRMQVANVERKVIEHRARGAGVLERDIEKDNELRSGRKSRRDGGRGRKGSGGPRMTNSDEFVMNARENKEFTSIFKTYARSKNATGVLFALKEMKRKRIKGNAFTVTAAINALVKADCWKTALSVFEDSIKRGIEPDYMTFSAIIPACRSKEIDASGWSEALAMYYRMLKAGIKPDAYSLSSTISTSAKSFHWDQALSLLNDAEKSGMKLNMVVYNAGLSACQTGGKGEYALKLLDSANKRGLKADTWSYNALISSLASSKNGDVTTPVRLLDDMERLTLRRNVVSYTAAITCCEEAKRGWTTALRLFEGMKDAGIKANIATYTSLLTCLITQRRNEETVDVLRDMQRDRIATDSAFFLTLARTAAGIGEWKRALSFLTEGKREKGEKFFVTNGFLYPLIAHLSGVYPEGDEIISGYLRELRPLGISSEHSGTFLTKDHDEKDRNLDQEVQNVMKAIVPLSNATVRSPRNEISDVLRRHRLASELSYSKLMNALSRESRWQDALITYEYAREKYKGAKQIYIAAMAACQKARRWSNTLDILGEMEDEGIKMDCPAYTLAIQAMGMRGWRRKAIKLLTKMRREGVRADNICYTAAILAADQVDNGRLAVTLIRRMEENQLKPDRITYNAALKSLERSGNWELAQDILQEMIDRKLEPNVISYNTLISSFRRSQNWEGAMRVALKLESVSVRADTITINSLVSNLEVGFRWEAALGLVQSARTRQIRADTITYTALISACARAKEWRKAVDLLQEMKEKGIQPNMATYSAAVEACDLAYEFERAAEIEKEAFEVVDAPFDLTETQTSQEEDIIEPDAPKSYEIPGKGTRSSFAAADRFWGTFTSMGTKKALNEDRSDVRGAQQVPLGRPYAYFAVYDGHGGAGTSQWLKERLAGYIDKYWKIDNLEESIRKAFLKADEAILKPKGGIFGLGGERGVGGSLCGSCASLAILYKTLEGESMLLTANVGDSVVILKKSNSIKPRCITSLHTPDNHTEFERVSSLPNPNPSLPFIREKGGRLRLAGSLGLTRSFGDAYLKPTRLDLEPEEEVETLINKGRLRESPYTIKINWTKNSLPLEPSENVKDFGLTAEPEMKQIKLNGDEDWILVASNGLVKQNEGDLGLTFDEIDEIIERTLENSKGDANDQVASPQAICAALASEARLKGSSDDITLILVPLRPSKFIK